VEPDFVKNCVGCGAPPPVSGEDTTLLSRRGWRLTRGNDKNGQIILEWRCPPCWNRHRAILAALGKK
jgi:hypothetical protein